VRTRLKKLLFEEHRHPGKNADRREEIARLDHRSREIERQMGETEKEVSRLDYLIEQGYVQVIARNAFYETLIRRRTMRRRCERL